MKAEERRAGRYLVFRLLGDEAPRFVEEFQHRNEAVDRAAQLQEATGRRFYVAQLRAAEVAE